MKQLLLSAAAAVTIGQQATGLYNPTQFEVKLVQDSNSKKFCETGQVITVEYTGHLKENGNVFDSTKEKGPFSFVLGQAEVIECWDEGFKKVPIGSKAKLECPAEMAYGNVMKRGIPENSDLEFEVELLGCEKDDLADLNVTELQQALEETPAAEE